MVPVKRSVDPVLAEECRTALLAARARLLKTVATTDHELATLETRQPGALAEDAAREEVVAILSRLGDREQDELEEIDAAWMRLDDGTFGLCEACGDALPLARLRAMATARYCLPCQAKRELRAPMRSGGAPRRGSG